jgi:hypothetical protein
MRYNCAHIDFGRIRGGLAVQESFPRGFDGAGEMIVARGVLQERWCISFGWARGANVDVEVVQESLCTCLDGPEELTAVSCRRGGGQSLDWPGGG